MSSRSTRDRRSFEALGFISGKTRLDRSGWAQERGSQAAGQPLLIASGESRCLRILRLGWACGGTPNHGRVTLRSSLVGRLTQTSTRQRKCPSGLPTGPGSPPATGKSDCQLSPGGGSGVRPARVLGVGRHPSPLGCQAAVHRNHLAGQVSGGGTREIGDEIGNLLGSSKPPQRNSLFDFVLDFLR